MKKIYHKLIRDKIPEIIIGAGETPKIRKLGQKEFRIELKKKVLEEAKELIKAKSKDEILNEMVDLCELLDFLGREFRINSRMIKTQKLKKNKERGSFTKKLFLIETDPSGLGPAETEIK